MEKPLTKFEILIAAAETLVIPDYETINRLKEMLQSPKDHKREILNQSDLKHAHIYCKIHLLSGQVSGPLI